MNDKERVIYLEMVCAHVAETLEDLDTYEDDNLRLIRVLRGQDILVELTTKTGLVPPTVTVYQTREKD